MFKDAILETIELPKKQKEKPLFSVGDVVLLTKELSKLPKGAIGKIVEIRGGRDRLYYVRWVSLPKNNPKSEEINEKVLDVFSSLEAYDLEKASS